MSHAFADGARWLQSDAQILGRLTSEPHEQGVLITLMMPWDENFQAVIEKMNATSMSEFCELARGEYGEWEARQDAAASRKRFDEREPERVQADVQGTQETVQLSPLDVPCLQRRYHDVEAQVKVQKAALGVLVEELILLDTILEAMNAPRISEEELPSVPSSEEGSATSESVAPDPRAEESNTGGAEGTGRAV